MMRIIDDAKRYIIPRRKFGTAIAYVVVNAAMILFQEGFIATVIYRINRLLKRFRLGVFSYILAKAGLFLTGIYINPDAEIGKGIKLNHSGTTIRADKIGEFAEITGSVTIGEREAFSDNCPVLGDHVYIGAGARIFANVGSHVIIGANAVVISDIPDNHLAVGIPAKPKKRDMK